MNKSVNVAVALAAVLVIAPAAGAQVTSFGEVAVAVESAPRGTSSHGYNEYVIAVANKSSQRPHRVTLTIPHFNHTTWADRLRALTRSVEIGPGTTARVSLLQPPFPPVWDGGLTVAIDGETQKDPVPLRPAETLATRRTSYGSFSSVHSGYGPSIDTAPLVLLSRGVPNEFQALTNPGPMGVEVDPGMGPGGAVPPGGAGMPPGKPRAPADAEGVPEAAPVLPPGMKPPGPGGVPAGPALPGADVPGGGWDPPGARPGIHFSFHQAVRADGPVTSWGTNWLGYSRYDGIVVTADELRKAPAGVQTALWQYTEAGGALVVLGDANVPEGWKRSRGHLHGFTTYQPGFGVCLVSADRDFKKWKPERWQLLQALCEQTAQPWGKVRGVLDANRSFPVVKDIGIPVRGLFALMLIAAAVIGPLNIWLLARKGRRMWMLWTVPCTSLATCLAVFGYMLLVEGWEGHLRTSTFTVLDESSHRASTLGWTAFYSPLTPGDGLHFSPETELFLQHGEDTSFRYGYGRGRGGLSCSLDWTGDQHLSRGWVTARVPAHFMTRKSELRRERVTVRRAGDGTLTAVNGLGADVKELHYADEKGRLYSAGPVAAGASVSLRPMSDKLAPPESRESLRSLYTSDWLHRIQTADPKKLLRPRSYLAVLESSPFLEDGLRHTRTRQYHALVLGLLKESDHED